MSNNINRRQFLLTAAGIAAATTLRGTGVMLGKSVRPSNISVHPDLSQRKLIVILFGGGTRSSESIDDPTHQTSRSGN